MKNHVAIKVEEETETNTETITKSVEAPVVGPMRKLKLKKGQQDSVAEEASKTESSNGVAKKRRWGTSQLLPQKKPALVISTDSLKVKLV